MLFLNEVTFSKRSWASSRASCWQASKNCLKWDAVSVKFLSLSANSRMPRVKIAKSDFFAGLGDLVGEEGVCEKFKGMFISMSVRDCQSSQTNTMVS